MVAISASTYSPLFRKGTESNISGFSIQDASIILSTDTHKVFLDSEGTTRVEISDFIKGYTAAQIVAKSAGAIYLNKIYRASDTNHLYVYQYDEGEATNVAVDITDFKVTAATSADTATYAVNAGSAAYATEASTANMYHADVADNAASAIYATNASSAEYATTASTAEYATSAGTATHASTADYATSAGTAAYASGPADESDWDFGVSTEFGGLTALVES